jgi:hypothetical protein
MNKVALSGQVAVPRDEEYKGVKGTVTARAAVVILYSCV